MNRRIAFATLSCLLVFSAVFAVTAVSATPSNVAITTVNTSVDRPAPGEPVTVTMEVRNPESSSGEIQITSTQIRKSGSATRYAYANDIGALGPGESVKIPLTVRFDDIGEKNLAAWATVRTPSNGIRTAKLPFFIEVTEPDDAVLSVRKPEEIDPVAGEETQINVSVSNSVEDTLSNVRLSLEGDARVESPDRVIASLDQGTQSSHTYQVTFVDAGSQTLNATVTYRSTGGSTRTLSREISTDVEDPVVDTDLTAATAQLNDSSGIEATLTEYGNVELRDGQVRAIVNGDTVTRTLVPDIPPEERYTVTLDGSDIPPGEVTVVARYTAAGEVRTVDTSVDYSPQQTAEITLSSVEASRVGGTLTLDGDAANLGSADARSVLVSVEDATGITPAAPNREYFIGQIPESEFDTFELTADVSPEVERVPVKIDYSVNGEQYSQTVAIDVSGASTVPENGDGSDSSRSNSSGGSSGGGFPLVIVALGLVVLGSLFLVYRWRKQ